MQENSFYELILAREGIQFAVFDETLRLKKASAALQESFSLDSSLGDVIPELAGMENVILASWEEGEELFIPRLNRPYKDEIHYLDIHLVPLGDQLLVILKDTTLVGKTEQKLMQQRNELALLSRSLEKNYRLLGALSG
ncbi:MAG: hypothetical protein ACK8QZ_08570, partial [Anaerolineales bacterium]